MKDRWRYYQCPNGHFVATMHKILLCPAYVHGAPCRADLKSTTAYGRKQAKETNG